MAKVREKDTAPAIPPCSARDDGAGDGGEGLFPQRPPPAPAATAAGEAVAPWRARAERRSEREARECAARSDLIVAGRLGFRRGRGSRRRRWLRFGSRKMPG